MHCDMNKLVLKSETKMSGRTREHGWSHSRAHRIQEETFKSHEKTHSIIAQAW